MKKYLRARRTGRYFSRYGTWDEWSKARLFEDMEILLRTAFQMEESDLEIVVTFSDNEPSEADITVPLSRKRVLDHAA